MADVKWIKITTDIFDDEKILLIESMPDADALIVIWFKLLCLAGKQNNSGVFLMNERIPYTDRMLATIFRRKESTVELALKTFEQFGMIERIENVITIPNWSKHQNLDKIERNNAYMREYMRKRREEQKLLASGKLNCKLNSKPNVNVADKEEDKKRVKKDLEISSREDTSAEVEQKPSYNSVKDLFNDLCPSFSPVRSLSALRKAKLEKLLETFTMEDFSEAFKNAENSDYLKGSNERGWKADFDWLIEEENFVKVLENRYRKYESTSTKKTEDLKDDDYEKEVERFINGQ